MTDRPDIELPTRGALGYAIQYNNRDYLTAKGMDVRRLLTMAAETQPELDPVTDEPDDLFGPYNQAQQGACQGHSLAAMFSTCFYLATGMVRHFSRGGAYYLSQKRDGLRGDVGSTLSAGMWVATQHGLCTEEDWPYPDRYNPTEPRGLAYKYKVVASRPTKDPEEIMEALDLGLVVQDGLIWTNELERSIVTNYTGRGGVGGHSTMLWRKNTRGNYWRRNSWGKWDLDGYNENTPQALKQQILHSQSDHIIYAPAGMMYELGV